MRRAKQLRSFLDEGYSRGGETRDSILRTRSGWDRGLGDPKQEAFTRQPLTESMQSPKSSLRQGKPSLAYPAMADNCTCWSASLPPCWNIWGDRRQLWGVHPVFPKRTQVQKQGKSELWGRVRYTRNDSKTSLCDALWIQPPDMRLKTKLTK